MLITGMLHSVHPNGTTEPEKERGWASPDLPFLRLLPTFGLFWALWEIGLADEREELRAVESSFGARYLGASL
jgi:hypothetical protein